MKEVGVITRTLDSVVLDPKMIDVSSLISGMHQRGCTRGTDDQFGPYYSIILASLNDGRLIHCREPIPISQPAN